MMRRMLAALLSCLMVFTFSSCAAASMKNTQTGSSQLRESTEQADVSQTAMSVPQSSQESSNEGKTVTFISNEETIPEEEQEITRAEAEKTVREFFSKQDIEQDYLMDDSYWITVQEQGKKTVYYYGFHLYVLGGESGVDLHTCTIDWVCVNMKTGALYEDVVPYFGLPCIEKLY